MVRSEIRLTQAETKAGAQKAAKASLPLVLGVLLGFYAAGFIFLRIVYALGLVLAPLAGRSSRRRISCGRRSNAYCCGMEALENDGAETR
jgi:hypothetical protein